MSELLKAVNPKQKAHKKWRRAVLVLALSDDEPFCYGDPN
jgi:hypothetical protein